MPDTLHAAIQMNLGFEIKSRYRHQYRVLSELALATIPDGTTPDVVIYPNFDLDYANRTARRADPPLVSIEIQSPSQSLEFMVEKTMIYFSFGVKSCWIVLPSIKAIMVYTEPGRYQFFHDEDILTDLNTGVELSLVDVFA